MQPPYRYNGGKIFGIGLFTFGIGCGVGKIIKTPVIKTGLVFGVSMIAHKLFTSFMHHLKDNNEITLNSYTKIFFGGNLVITGATLVAFSAMGIFGTTGLVVFGIYDVLNILSDLN